MRKKIIFGTILVAFLMLSIAWLTPVQVKAYEMQSAREIRDKINEMGKSLKNDENVQQLIDLHSNQEIENIFKQVIAAESSDEIQTLANEYVDIIGFEELNQIYEDINQEYLVDYNSIISSLNNLFGKENNNGNNFGNFRVEQVNGKLKVKKLDNIELKENSLVFTNDGKILFPDGQNVTLDIWEKLSDFCFFLGNIGLAVEYVGLIIEWIGLILSLLGYEELGDSLVDIGLAVGIIGFIWATIFYALSAFFNELSDDKSKNKENTNFRLIEVLRIRILSIIRQFFQRISC